MGRKILRSLRIPLLLLILAWRPLLASAASGELQTALDLAADAKLMREQRLPMLVLYSQDDCSWCDRVRREYLLPLQQAPETQKKLLLRQIDLDSDADLIDFGGRKTTHRRYAREEKARVTPTLMLYGASGARLAEPIVGFRLADFYAEYINRAIEQGQARLSKPAE